MLHRVELCKRDAYGGDAYEFRTFGSERAARNWVAPLLGTISVTNDTYHRDLGRANYARVIAAKGDVLQAAAKEDTIFRRGLTRGMSVYYIYPEVVVVPSVGELGYTP